MKPWERQESESEKAFAAFRAYLDAGEKRSTRTLAVKLGKSDTLIGRWSSKWRWQERVAAYTAHLQQVAQKATEKEVMKQARKIISSKEVLEELTEIAQCDWREFVEIRYSKDGEILNANLRLSDKLKALELAGKYHKLFTERTESVDLTEHEGVRAFIANEVTALARQKDKPAEVCEAELQRLWSDTSLPNYDKRLDVSKHPEEWPSGRSLIAPTPEATEAVN